MSADLVVVPATELAAMGLKAEFCGHCGRPFEWVAKTESGKILAYWCPACDQPGQRKQARS